MIHYTTIEQSKKLLELGLSPESADMRWVALNWQETEYYVEAISEGFDVPKSYVPCWSLGALLEVLPTHIQIKSEVFHYEMMPDFGSCLIQYKNVEGDKILNQSIEDTLLEATYSMVVWLLENDYIEKKVRRYD